MAADHISIREKQQVLKLLAPALQAADPGIRELRLSADGSRVDIHTANGNVRPKYSADLAQATAQENFRRRGKRHMADR